MALRTIYPQKHYLTANGTVGGVVAIADVTQLAVGTVGVIYDVNNDPVSIAIVGIDTLNSTLTLYSNNAPFDASEYTRAGLATVDFPYQMVDAAGFIPAPIPASDTVNGIVRLNRAAPVPAVPVVPVFDAGGRLGGVSDPVANDDVATMGWVSTQIGSAAYLPLTGGMLAPLTDTIPLTINAILGQTAKLQSWQVNGSEKAWLAASGELTVLASMFVPGGSGLWGRSIGNKIIMDSAGSVSLGSVIADGAAAVAFNLNTSPALTIAGAKLLSIKNNSVEKFSIDKDGITSTQTAFKGTGANAYMYLGAANQLQLTGSDSGGTLNTIYYTAGAGNPFLIGSGANCDIVLNPGSGAKNVGIRTTAPTAPLNIRGANAEPPTTGATQSATLRIQPAPSWGEALDMGFHVGTSGPPSYAWLQSTNAPNLSINYNLVLNPNGGNVGVRTTSPSTTLHIRQSAVPAIPNLGTGATQGIFLAGDSGLYGLYTAMVAAGDAWMQVQRNDSVVAYNLLLQPRAGSVGIGLSTGVSASLHVKSNTVDGASVVATIIDTSSSWITSGAKLLSVRNAGVEKAYFDKGGYITSAGSPVSRKVAVPATAASAGIVGDWAADASWLYICTATNTWERTAITLATW